MFTFSDAQLRSVLRLQGCEPEPDSVVVELERRLGIVFPTNLKRLWAFGEESALYFSGFAESPYCSALSALKTHHFEFCSSTIEERVDLLKEEFPGVIPIGGGGDGSMLVLDYRRSSEPVVLKYDLDIVHRTNAPFYYMARNADEMIDRGLVERQAHYTDVDGLMTNNEVELIIGFPAEVSFANRKATAGRPADYFLR